MNRTHRLITPARMLARPIVALGLAALGSWASAEMLAAEQLSLPARAPFYITPVVEGLVECLGAKRYPVYEKFFDPESLCVQQGFSAAAALAKLLDPLEPGGPAGKVQLGYTATIPLLGMYRKDGANFVFDDERLDDYMALVQATRRPVVVYLVADHFDSRGALPEALAADSNNMLQLANGTVPTANYFGNKVLPYTLLADDDLPVNRYRFEAARHVLARLAALPGEVRQRIVAVTLAGELHQMFRDFENGMGAFQEVQVTDYHPRSVALFRTWLAQKYGAIDAFNKANGFKYTTYDVVPAPAKDIRRDKLESFGEHYDGFAHGELPVSGWLWDPERRVDRLELFIDGQSAGDISRGFNRLDVYRAVEEVDDPNVGFRLDLPFDTLPLGRHVGQVVAHTHDQHHLLGQFDFNIVGRDQAALAAAAPQQLPFIEPLTKVAGVRASLDLPKPSQDLYFNPLARDWNSFRAEQVLAFLKKFHTIAVTAGIAEDKLYSHQIVPQVNSSWNAKLFAVDKTLIAGLPWRTGLNMYGGAADSDWMRRFIAERRLADYGVPEFNPQQWKRPGLHTHAMTSHYKGGARFVSPYFLSILTPRAVVSLKTLDRMEIRPDNQMEGSAAFYRAIQTLAKQ